MNKRPFILGLGRNVFFVGLVSLFMDVSSEMVYPLLPLFLTEVLGVTRTTVGIIEGIAEATASLLKVVSGWLSDRLGKRKLLMAVGYGVSALSRPVIAGAAAWGEVLGARFIDRFGKGIRTAPRDAIIADSTSHEGLGRAFGFHRAMDTFGAAIGPGAAFVLLALTSGDLRFVFYASTVPAAVALLVLIIFIKERPSGGGGAPEEAGRKKLPRLTLKDLDGGFRRYMLVIGVFSLATFSDAFVILRARDLGVSEGLVTVVYLLFNLVYALSSMPLGSLADRVGLRRMVLAGFVFFSLVFLGFALATSALHAWLLFILYGVYKGMSEGTQRAYLAFLSPPGRKATAFGVYHMVVGLMLLPSSIIAGVLWDIYGPHAAFFFGSAMGLAAAAVFSLRRG